MRLLPALLPLLLTSCASFFGLDGASDADRGEVEQRVEQADALLEQGRAQEAVELLVDVQDAKRLDTITRHQVELLLERGAFEWLDQMVAEDASAKRLEDLFEENVPRRARVSAGVAAARKHLAEDRLLEAYQMIRRVEEKFPTHHERTGAGEVLVQAGFRLARSEKKYFWFFDLRDRASEVLEYLVLNHPSNPSCEEAYLALAALYEEEGRIDVAQERHEDLVLFYPSSRFAPYSESRIPELRMRQVRGPRYDRSELDQARGELQNWLFRHPDDERVEDVEEILRRCKRLIVESDLIVAGFYRRVDKDFGTRMHLGRALELAREIGDQALVAEALDLLEDLGVEESAL